MHMYILYVELTWDAPYLDMKGVHTELMETFCLPVFTLVDITCTC